VDGLHWDNHASNSAIFPQCDACLQLGGRLLKSLNSYAFLLAEELIATSACHPARDSFLDMTRQSI